MSLGIDCWSGSRTGGHAESPQAHLSRMVSSASRVTGRWRLGNLLIAGGGEIYDTIAMERFDKADAIGDKALMKFVGKGVSWMILGYRRFFSPFTQMLGAQCRYYPSCSQYAQMVFERHSFWTALRMSLYRLWRCQGWYSGGIDDPMMHPAVLENHS